jgi:hypothetical protein
MNTVEYLTKNYLEIGAAIQFTINDLIYIKIHNLDTLIINGNKETREEMTEEDTITRLKDLYKLAIAVRIDGGPNSIYPTPELYSENLTEVYKQLEADFNIDLGPPNKEKPL